MSCGLQQQIERSSDLDCNKRGVKKKSIFKAFMKAAKHRAERRRAKRDPEALPRYRRYKGWEY